MIPVLYPKNEKQFRHYGLGEVPFSKCEVTRVRNGEYSLYAEISAEEPQSDLLVEGLLLKADAGVRTKWQTFEIVRIVRNSDDVVKVYANHVSMSTIYSVMNPNVKVSNVDATGALNMWLGNIVGDNDFQVWSDITTLNSTTWTVESIKNARDALGGARGSILDVWGGEYEFDNRLIRLHKQMGRKAPTTIEYGRNLVSAENEIDISETYTSVFPFAIKQSDDGNNNHVITLDEKVVHSEHVARYATTRILQVDFSSEFKDNEEIAQDKLRRLAIKYIKQNDVGVPKGEIELSYVDLASTLDYEQMSIVEEVELCDILPVYYSKLKITNSRAKVSKVVYDVLLNENQKIHVGMIGKTFRETVLSGVQNAVADLQHRTAGIEALPIWQLASNGINTIWYDTPPTDREHKKGDIWFEKNGNYMRMHIWNGTAWVKEFDQEDKEEIDRKLSEIDTKVEQANQDLSAERQRLDGVLTDLGVTKDLAQEGKNIAQSALNNAVELSAKVLETEEGLNVFKDETNERITQELAKVEGKIPTAIGGRNLITGTQHFDGVWTNKNLWSKESETYNGLTVYSKSSKHQSVSKSVQVYEGETYTFSAYVNLSKQGNVNVLSSRVATDTDLYYKSFTLEPGWQKVSITFTALKTTRIEPNVSLQQDSIKISVCGYKLERGSIATDWSPAPEDTVSLTQFNRLEETAEGVKRSISKVEQRFPKKQLPLVNTAFNNVVRYYFIVLHDILADYVGKEAKVTFDLKVEQDGTERELLFYHYQHSGIGIKLGEEAQPHVKINATKQWQTFSFSGEVIRKPIPATYHQGAMIIYDPTGNNKFSVRNIKIEVDDVVTSVEFNNVRETAQLYESIIGRTEADATTNISRMLRSSELFMSEITTGGRRNLYTGTKNFDGSDWGTPIDWQATLKWSESTTKYKGCKVLYTKHMHNGLWQNIEVKKDDKITFTAIVYSQTAMKVHILGKWDNAPFPATSPKAGLDKLSEMHNVPAGAWTKVSTTFTVTSDGSMQPRIEKRASDNEPDKTLFITQIMVEKGENPTKEWTESPHEQVTNRIAQIGRLLELGLFGQEGILDGILIGRDTINIKSKLINLDGDVRMNSAFVTKLITQHLDTNTLRAMVANINQLNAIQVNANRITGFTSEFLRSIWNGINNRISIDGNALVASHTDGSRTVLSPSGLFHEEGGTYYRTHYLTEIIPVGDILHDGRDNGGVQLGVNPGYKWVQLPGIFKGKRFKAQISYSDADTWRAGDDYRNGNIQLLRPVCFVPQHLIDYENARVPIVGYAHVFNRRTWSRYNYPVWGQLMITY